MDDSNQTPEESKSLRASVVLIIGGLIILAAISGVNSFFHNAYALSEGLPVPTIAAWLMIIAGSGLLALNIFGSPDLARLSVQTPSQPILYFACGMVAAFFMPWVQLFGGGLSGYQLGRLGSYGNWLWVIPILATTTISFSLSGRNNRIVGVICGIVPILAVLYLLVRLTSQAGQRGSQDFFEIATHVLAIGAYLTLIFSGCLICAALAPVSMASLTAAPTVPSPPADKLSQLERLAKLRSEGVLTEEEFAAQKEQILEKLPGI